MSTMNRREWFGLMGAGLLAADPLCSLAASRSSNPQHNAVIRDITWRQAPDLRYALKGQAQGVIGNELVIAGGTEVGNDPAGAKASNRAWLFDPKKGTYENLPDIPEILWWPEGAVIDDDFYVVSGLICRLVENQYKARIESRLWRLSRKTGNWKWEELARPKIDSAYSGIAAAGKHIVVVGGSMGIPGDTEAAACNDVEGFDTQAPEKGWRFQPPVPGPPRVAPATVAIGRQVYVFGGWFEKTWVPKKKGQRRDFLCGDAYVFNVDTDQWRQLPDLPTPAYGWDAAVYRDRYIILAGGIKAEHNEDVHLPYESNFDVLLYDTEAQVYQKMPTPLPPFPATDRLRLLIKQWKTDNSGEWSWSKLFDWSKGSYRLSPRLSFIGDDLYLIGDEVMGTQQNASKQLLIGRLITEPAK